MGFWKGLACVVGGIGAIVAAPIVLPALATAAAAAGTVAAGAAGAAAATASAAGAAIASTAVGSAVVGAASTVAGAAAAAGTAAAGAAGAAAATASAAGAAIASTTVGSAVVGAAATVGTAATGAVTAVTGAVGSLASGACAAAGISTGTAAVGVVGGSMTYSAVTIKEAFENFDSAKRMAEDAKALFEVKSKELDVAIEMANRKLSDLTKLKMQISANEIKESVALLKKIRNTQAKTSDYSEGKLYNESQLKNIEEGVSIATGVLNKISSGLSVSSVLPTIAQTLVKQFGIASTGTSISSLSGAAAQRATLAALGGGSLQSGGAGMLGGQIMLGGLSLVPTAVFMAWKMASNSQKALTEAYDYYCQVTKTVEGIENQKSFVQKGVCKRIEEIETCLNRLRSIYAFKILPNFRSVVSNNQSTDGSVDFAQCPPYAQDTIILATYFIKSIRKIMEVKVLDENGCLDENGKAELVAIEKDPKITEMA